MNDLEPLNENLSGHEPGQAHNNRGRPLPPKETRWKKGQSGNPRGRPKKRDSLTDLIRQTLGKRCHTDPEKRTWGELFVQALIHSALKGNAMASKLILERHEGKDGRWGRGNDWNSKSPEEQRSLSRAALNQIRTVYGLEPMPGEDDEPST